MIYYIESYFFAILAIGGGGSKFEIFENFKKVPQDNLEVQVVSKFEVDWMKTVISS